MDNAVEKLPGEAPTAFRIWKAGVNMTDMGPHVFSPKSAELLMKSQAERGNRFSIDVDHMSLNKESPPESRKAVGWHSLQVRDSADGPELWAVACEWTDAVRAGLAADPPEWRYFSPAYQVNKETGEIVAYTNTALTNNPATHRVTALASLTAQNREKATQTKGFSMDFRKMASAMFGDDEEEKKAAKEYLSTASETVKKAWKAYKKAAFEDDDGEKEEKPKEEAAKASESEEEAAKASESEDEKKEAALASRVIAAVKASLAPTLAVVETFKATQAASEVQAILATRPDLDDKTKAFLGTLAPAQVKAAIEALPKMARTFQSTAANTTSGVRGATQGDFDPPVSSEQQAALDKAFGVQAAQGPTGLLTIGSGDVQAAKKHLAVRASQAAAAEKAGN